MATVLAYTTSGVEQVEVLDPARLAPLAHWLCDEIGYHDRVQPWNGSTEEAERFEYEKRLNSGYCNACRDFAGQLLAESPLRTLPTI